MKAMAMATQAISITPTAIPAFAPPESISLCASSEFEIPVFVDVASDVVVELTSDLVVDEAAAVALLEVAADKVLLSTTVVDEPVLVGNVASDKEVAVDAGRVSLSDIVVNTAAMLLVAISDWTVNGWETLDA